MLKVSLFLLLLPQARLILTPLWYPLLEFVFLPQKTKMKRFSHPNTKLALVWTRLVSAVYSREVPGTTIASSFLCGLQRNYRSALVAKVTNGFMASRNSIFPMPPIRIVSSKFRKENEKLKSDSAISEWKPDWLRLKRVERSFEAGCFWRLLAPTATSASSNTEAREVNSKE